MEPVLQQVVAVGVEAADDLLLLLAVVTVVGGDGVEIDAEQVDRFWMYWN